MGDILANIGIFLFGIFCFLMLISGFLPEKIWGKKDKEQASKEISEYRLENSKLKDTINTLEADIRKLRSENDKLRQERLERSNNFLAAVQNAADQKNYLLTTDLRESHNKITKYQKALEHCTVKHAELINEIPHFSDPHFEDKLVSFSKAIKIGNDKLTSINRGIIDKEIYLSELISIDNSSKVISRTIRRAFREQYNIRSFFDRITTNRLNTAINSDIFLTNVQFSANIHSKTKIYHVTLTNCTCDDFKNKHKPCKHILYFAYSLGLLQFNNQECEEYTKSSIKKLNSIIQEKTDLEKKIKNARNIIKQLADKQKVYKKIFEKYDDDIDSIAKKKCAGYPELAGMVSDYKTLFYAQAAQYLKVKKHPAPTEALRINDLRIEAKRIEEEKSILEYKLGYIYKLYPEIKQIFADNFDDNNKPKLDE